jgi:glycosyltransferase involved in cell wall biosynthesis
MPQALLEAMTLGKLVISSDTLGGKELINNGKSGFLFEKGNEKSLAERLNYCNSNFNSLNRIMANAKNTASKFKWAKIADNLEKLYKSKD